MTRDLSANLDTTGKTLWQLVSERALTTPDKRMAFEIGRAHV